MVYGPGLAIGDFSRQVLLSGQLAKPRLAIQSMEWAGCAIVCWQVERAPWSGIWAALHPGVKSSPEDIQQGKRANSSPLF